MSYQVNWWKSERRKQEEYAQAERKHKLKESMHIVIWVIVSVCLATLALWFAA